MTEPAESRTPSPVARVRLTLIRRVLLNYTVAVLFLLLIALLWFASGILLLIFSAILIAVLLTRASAWLEKWFHMRHGIALAIVLLALVGLIVLAAWQLAPQVAAQARELSTSLPSAFERVRNFMSQAPLLDSVVQGLPDPAKELDLRALASRVGTVFSGVFGIAANVVIVLFVSIYLAAQPQVYVNGFVTLFPKPRRQRICAVLHRVGEALGLWLLGKLLAMLVVGSVVAIGLTLLEVPLALVLGLVAGLFEFIPYLGPILAGVPALLIAFAHDPMLAFYVFLLFAGVQFAEGYFLTPIVDRHTVSLPPALTISMQVLLAVPFGLLGVALASPLTAAIVVLVSMLYVQDVLDDPVTPPGGN